MSWRPHWSYFKYVLAHKWYVLVAGRRLRLGWWRLLVHDWSKFSREEWSPYVHTFYADDGSKHYDETPEFNTAWLHHQRRNRHHWQYWALRRDSGGELLIEMPQIYVTEMVADWSGAGRAITGAWDPGPWYEKNKNKIQLHENTRQQVEDLIRTLQSKLDG